VKKFKVKHTVANGPEAKIQKRIIQRLRYEEWFVKETHGNMYQSGFPDLFATHSLYGHRWIEVKNPERTSNLFTNAQLENFPKLCAHGSGVWVLTDDSDSEYQKLFKRFNWYVYCL